MLLSGLKGENWIFINNLVYVGKDKEQEWEWGLRSLDNEHSIRLPRSERVASLQRNENGKVPNGDSVSYLVSNHVINVLIVLLSLIFPFPNCRLVEM